jgi:hypothetical protein
VRSLGYDMSVMRTGIYGATPQWARIGAIMVVCACHDALAAEELPQQIIGHWCLTSEAMLPDTYAIGPAKTTTGTSSYVGPVSTRRRPVATSTRSTAGAGLG